MARHYIIFLFQSFETAEILLLVFPILVGTGLAYHYVKRRGARLKIATRKCLHCAKMIDSDAKICPVCQRMIL